MSSNDESVPHGMDVPIASTPMNKDDCLAWERELLRRERELIQEERTLMNRKQLNNTSMADSHFLKEAGELIPNFDPSGNLSLTAEQWVRRVDGIADTYGWDPRTTLLQAALKLKGAARFWFDGCRDYVDDWQLFRVELLKGFPSMTDEADVHWALSSRKKKADEPYETYCYEIVAIGRRGGLSDSALRKYIIAGIAEPDVRRILALTKFSSLQELIMQLRAYEDTTKQNFEVGETSKNVEKTNTQGRHSQKTQDVAKKNAPKCYNCLEMGHLASACNKPKMKICYACRKDGHLAKDCPEKKKKTIQVVNEKMRDEDRCKYCKMARVNGKEVEAFVDPGSSVCTMRKECAIKMKLNILDDRQPLYAFGDCNKAAVTTHGVVKADVQVDGATVEGVELHVVPDEAQPTDVLLGRTFTEDVGIAYVRIDDRLVFAKREDEPFRDMEIPEKQKQITLKSGTKIRGGCINFVQVRAGKREDTIALVNGTPKDKWLEEGAVVGKMDAEPNHEIDVVLCQEDAIFSKDVDVDDEISEEDRGRLLELINEYRDVFARSLEELGCTDVMSMDIVDTGEPVRSKPYKMSAKEREVTKEIVREWKRMGIVSETDSSYASPVLLVTKNTGEPRLVVDYRKLNNQTQRISYPMSTIDEQFECLAGSSLFTTLDLAHGYLQIPLTEEAKKKTAFITLDETGQFERVMFGLMNAPYVFCKMMTKVLGPLKGKVVQSFVDDILVPASDWDDMMTRLRLLFDALRKANLTLKLRKCVFGRKEVQYLGHKLTAEGISPGATKVGAILNFPEPTEAQATKRFFGLASYFRRYIPRFAERAKPLSDLTKRSTNFVWTAREQAAFEDLKKELTSDPVLKLFDPKARTELHTDASAAGIAGMLMQEGNDGNLHLVYAVSKKTTDTESRYHSSKLELMAVVWSMERLREMLIGIEFTVVTDCQALVYLNTQKTTNPQVARWSQLIQEYDVTIKHRSGERMAHVDALSRAPTLDACNTLEEVLDKKLEVFELSTVEGRVEMMQACDSELKRLIDILNKPMRERTARERVETEEYELKNGKLLKKTNVDGEDRLLYVLPKSARKGMVAKYHDQMGHFSTDRVVNKLLETYWFRRMRRYVKQHVRCCVECLLTKVPGGKQQGKLNPIPTAGRPFERIHLDHLGPFPKSSRGNRYILLAVDGFSKFVKLFAVPNTKAAYTLRKVREFVMQFGLPRRIVTDRGTCFTSEIFKKYCEENGIHHTLNSSRHPQANGQVERVNRVLLPMLMNVEEEQKWDAQIEQVNRNMNVFANKTTAMSPFEVVYGYRPTYEEDGRIRAIIDEEGMPRKNLEKLRENVKKRTAEEQDAYKRRYDRKRCEGAKYRVGDMVVVKVNPTSTGQSTKLQSKYKGPYEITEVLPSDTYGIRRWNRSEGREYHTTAHVSQMKGCENHEETEDDTEPEDDDGTSRGREVLAAWSSVNNLLTARE